MYLSDPQLFICINMRLYVLKDLLLSVALRSRAISFIQNGVRVMIW